MKTESLAWGRLRVTEDASKEEKWGSEEGCCVHGKEGVNIKRLKYQNIRFMH